VSSAPAELQSVIDLLGDYKGQWAIAGGWAIDLFLGRSTRAHAEWRFAGRDFARSRAAAPGRTAFSVWCLGRQPAATALWTDYAPRSSPR